MADRGRSGHILVGNPQKNIGEEGGRPNTFLEHILARYLFFSRLPTCLQGDFYGTCVDGQIVADRVISWWEILKQLSGARGEGGTPFLEHILGWYVFFSPSARGISVVRV